jgi:type IV secretory pathway protease TraF
MSRDTKRLVAVVLAVAAVVLIGAGFVLNAQAKEDAEQASQVGRYRDAILGVPPSGDVEPNRTPATIAWVAGGSAALAAVIFLATLPPRLAVHDGTPDPQ